jgi:hypothetical protein
VATTPTAATARRWTGLMLGRATRAGGSPWGALGAVIVRASGIRRPATGRRELASPRHIGPRGPRRGRGRTISAVSPIP